MCDNNRDFPGSHSLILSALLPPHIEVWSCSSTPGPLEVSLKESERDILFYFGFGFPNLLAFCSLETSHSVGVGTTSSTITPKEGDLF